ncbi:MAG: 2TM domain-containing protein [Microcoleaceae cyanobacterium]
MPPRWPRQPDRQDLRYRKLDDRMTFATHVALFSAVNSGVWFVRNLKDADWPWAIWITSIWFGVLLMHAVYIFAIADYSPKAPS